MSLLPENLQKLIEEFVRLPGLGPKSAQRLAFHLLKSKKERLKTLAETISNLKENITLCEECCNLTTRNPCKICTDLQRDKSTICVTEETLDVIAIEKTGFYKGLYHILHGVISPLNNIGPEDLTISVLMTRLKENPVKEIILATNPTLEGEATAMYIAKLVKPLGVKTTRIARGLPTGGDIEYADDITVTNALKGRQEY